MGGFALSVATTSAGAATSSFFFPKRNPICPFSLTTRRTVKARKLLRGSNKFVVFASKDEPKFDPLDLMELKFGRMLGEDPKLTLAKIMGRKTNPDASYLEIEKSFYKNKGKMPEVKEVPIDWSKDGQSSKSLDGLNLVRPVPKRGFEIKADDKPAVSEIRRPNRSVGKPVDSVRRSVPNVILRKPTVINEGDVDDRPSRLKIRSNLTLRMRTEPVKEKFSDMTLLRKPEPTNVNKGVDGNEEISGGEEANVVSDMEFEVRTEEGEGRFSDFTLLNKPKEMPVKKEIEDQFEQFGNADYANAASNNFEESKDDLFTEKPTRLQPQEESVIGSTEERTAEKGLSNTSSVVSNVNLTTEAALRGKPKRLDQSVKATSPNPASVKKPAEFDSIPVSSPGKGQEDADWSRAEDLVKTGDRGDVELISCSTRGFVVSFGSLIGFLPYRNLSAKWKFLAFESWLRRKGLDPSLYRQNLGIIGSYDALNNSSFLNPSLEPNIDLKSGGEISPDMKMEELLRIYDQEKIKFLSSFVGQKVKVNVLLASRKSGKLIFSVKPKEKEEMVEKKRSLMAKLQVGDIVKCCIKKITYFGIFVEVEGVPALIHQTEVSWDATLDPLSYFKVGQIVDAKVHQLDFSLDRIFLSLKEIMPDPLIETLESVVDGRDPLDGRLEAAQADTEWPDVESLVKELQKIEGIQSVSKGRFFLSPGLAPTFQVYMASMFETQYKLLARSENKVQEVIVETSLDKEELKSAILTCTNRVE
ncbi:hypothetical protein UlMin_001881 [Ulmus minor]